MPNHNSTSIVAHTELELQLLTGWRSYAEIPEAVHKVIPFFCHMVGVLANALLVIYLIHSRKCRVPIFCLFTSLAICDWLTCFTTAIYAVFVFPEVVFTTGGKEICKTLVYAFVIAYETSICHLVFLAALRFYQLVYPLQAKARVTTKLVLKCCGVMWILCGVISVPYPMYYTVTPVPHGNGTLWLYHFVGNSKAKEIALSIFTQTFPLVIIILLHVIKLFKVSKGSQITETERQSTSSRTVTLLITCFIISLLPRLLHTSYHNLLGFPNQSFHLPLFYYSSMITAANSIVDPFLYLLGSKEIRQDIGQMIFCKKINKPKG